MAELVEVAELNITKCISDVCENNDILSSYLKLIGRFPLFDYRNQLLIWKQCPDATTIAGKNVFERTGNKLPDDAQKILLLIPKIIKTVEGQPKKNELGQILVEHTSKEVVYDIVPEYASEYEAIVAYDVSSYLPTYQSYPIDDLTNKIKFCTQYSINEIEVNDLTDKNTDGELDNINNAIRIKKGISENVYAKELLCQYIESERDTEPLDDYEECFRALAKYVVCHAFGIEDKRITLMRAKYLRNGDLELKKRMLQELSTFTSEVITDLSTMYLTFNEVILANCLVRTDKYNILEIDFLTVKEHLSDIYLREQIDVLSQKLFKAQEGYLEELLEKIQNHELFTYPPYPFRLCQDFITSKESPSKEENQTDETPDESVQAESIPTPEENIKEIEMPNEEFLG